MPDFDTYDLPPTQALVLEVLAARYRLGETYWSFSVRHRPTLERLERRGLVSWKPSPAPGACMAWLTDAGRVAVLSGTYQPPALGEWEVRNGDHVMGGYADDCTEEEMREHARYWRRRGVPATLWRRQVTKWTEVEVPVPVKENANA